MIPDSKTYCGRSMDGRGIACTVQGRTIQRVEPRKPETDDPWLLPPLVDLQQNGALGLAFNDLDDSLREQLRAVAHHLIRNGVGRVLATLTTCSYSRLAGAVAAFDRLVASDPELSALFCGLFHEGVFISPLEGWRGGHLPAFIRQPDWATFCNLQKASGNRIRLVNVAPEQPGAMAFIERAVGAGVGVALGHCCPDTNTIRQAVKLGARAVTHFANGSAPHIHRFKNPFWEFMNNDMLSLGLVGDGFHLPPEVVQTALKLKGLDRCFMVSDANPFSGCSPGKYQRTGGKDFVIEPNGHIHLQGCELLAGGWFQNNRSVEYLARAASVPFIDAWRLCSEIPARLVGADLPLLNEGDEATFVLAEWRDEQLRIRQSVFCGKEYL